MHQAGHAAERALIPPSPRPCSFAPSLTTPLYSISVSKALRQTLRNSFLARVSRTKTPLPREQAMYACILETGVRFFEGVCTPSNATAHPYDPPPPATQEKRSPIARAPAQRGSRAALTWAALQLGVDVNHHPSCARAPLASHPPTTLNVVNATLEASQAGALLVGTRLCSGHDLMP